MYLMNIDGSGKKEIKTGLDRSVSNLNWDSRGSGLFFQYDDKGNTKIGYTTLSGKTELVAGNLGGTAIGRPYGGGSYSVSKNGRIAYTYNTPDFPAEVAVVERSSKPRIVSGFKQRFTALQIPWSNRRNLVQIIV